MIPGKNYFSIRYKLISKSLTFGILVKELRKFYKLLDGEIKIRVATWDSIYWKEANWLMENYQSQFQVYFNKFPPVDDKGLPLTALNNLKLEIFEPIYKIAQKLGIDQDIFEEAVLFGVMPEAKGDRTLRVVFGKDFPLAEPGVYFKIGPYTSASDLTKSLQTYKGYIERFYKVNFKLDSRKKSTGSNPQKELELYSKIEAMVAYYYARNKMKKSLGPETSKTYERVLSYAIADIASDGMSENLSEAKYEARLNATVQKLTNSYYEIASRYSIPTMRDIPSFLALIPNK